MKKLIKLLTLILLFSFIYQEVGASEFCDGFERGYITDYKQSSGSSYDPYTPYCPYQPYKGYNDPESDYEHGYIIGYEQGLKEAPRE
jgi:hypothetical protein